MSAIVGPRLAKIENLKAETEQIVAIACDLSQRQVPGAYNLVESIKYDWKQIFLNLDSVCLKRKKVVAKKRKSRSARKFSKTA